VNDISRCVFYWNKYNIKVFQFYVLELVASDLQNRYLVANQPHTNVETIEPVEFPDYTSKDL